MKNKKKTNSVVQKQPQNKPRTIRTSDGKEFKVVDSLLMKYSMFLKNLIEDQKSQDQTFPLSEVDSQSFQIINEFMQLHKDKEPNKIELPLKSNQNLKLVLDEADANLVQKVINKGDQFLLKVLQTTSLLQIQQLKKRLIAGLAIKLMKTTVGELQKQYDLSKYDIKDEQIKEQAQARLKSIFQMKQQQ